MAYILYIDESYDKKSNYIVMAGFGVSLSNWNVINRELNNIKSNYFYRTSLNLKRIRRKNYDEHQYWEKLSKEKKEKFNEEFYEVVCNPKNLVLAAVINKKEMEKKGKELSFYLAYGFILQRYQYFLSEKKEKGLIVMDSAESSKEIKNLYEVHKKFMEEGVPTQRKDSSVKLGGKEVSFKDYERLIIKNICENLIFQKDEDNNMLQIVDMIAGAINAKYNRGFNKWFDFIEKIIRKSPEGKIEGYGIKSFP